MRRHVSLLTAAVVLLTPVSVLFDGVLSPPRAPAQAAALPSATIFVAASPGQVTFFDNRGGRQGGFSGSFVSGDALAVGDFDGDRVADILVAHRESGVGFPAGQIDLYDQRTGKRQFFSSGFRSDDAFALGDLDGDGVAEAIVADHTKGKLTVFRWDSGLVGRSVGELSSTFTTGDGLAVGDVDGDGLDEVLVANDESGRISIYKWAYVTTNRIRSGTHEKKDIQRQGQLLGEFSVPTGFKAGDGFASGDLDANGVDEILVASEPGERLYVFRWDPATKQSLKLGDFPAAYAAGDALTAGDVNGDFRDEFLLANNALGSIQVFRWDRGQPDEPTRLSLFAGGFTRGGGFGAGISPDLDGDGLPNTWEASGLDLNGDGKIDSKDINLHDLGADPLHKDLFIELDWTFGGMPIREELEAVRYAFETAPVDAGGLANPDGKPGITLHIDTGGPHDLNATEGPRQIGTCANGKDDGGDGLVDGADTECRYLDVSIEDRPRHGGFGTCLDGSDNDRRNGADAEDPSCWAGDRLGGGNEIEAGSNPELATLCGLGTAEFYKLKARHFNPARAPIFRYAISAGPLPAACTVQLGGQAELGGNDLIVFAGRGPTGSRVSFSGIFFIHELGHALSLGHGGFSRFTGFFDNHNCKPNYVSVMNYSSVYGIARKGGGYILDFSPPRIALDGSRRGQPVLPRDTRRTDSGELVEYALDEQVPLDATDDANLFVHSDKNGQPVTSPLNQPVNWNGSTKSDGTDNLDAQLVSFNIDRNDFWDECKNSASSAGMDGADDWRHLSLPFQQFGDSLVGPAFLAHPETPEATLEQVATQEKQLNTSDLRIQVTDSPDPVVAGEELTYTLIVANGGPNPAHSVRVVDTLPAAVVYRSDDAGCTQAPAGTLTCDLGEVLPRTTRQIQIRVQVPTAQSPTSGPTTIANAVEVSNLAPLAQDPDPKNNSAQQVTQLADRAAAPDSRLQPPLAALTETVAGGVPAPGRELAYRVFFSLSQDAREVVIQDDFLDGLSLAASPVTLTGPRVIPSVEAVLTARSNDREVRELRLGDLPAGSYALSFSASIPATKRPGQTVSNSVTVYIERGWKGAARVSTKIVAP